MFHSLKHRVFNLIRDDDENDVYSNIFDGTIIALIVINVLLVVLDTFNIPSPYDTISGVIETVSVIIFTVEYLARVWVADLRFPGMTPFRARLKYIFSFMALVDLIAILPFYVPFIIPVDLRVLRALRLVRLFRLFKVGRYTTAFTTIADVFKRKAHQLISSLLVVGLLMVIASILMYNVEHDAQPGVFDNALSGLWWAIATLTTVGYGDIYPVTVAGKILSAIIALLGIGLVAVPTGIISAGFMEAVEKPEDDEEKQFCPYCGKQLK